MRRSRIKAVATVPVRRKQTKDNNEEKIESPESVTNEVSNNGEKIEEKSADIPILPPVQQQPSLAQIDNSVESKDKEEILVNDKPTDAIINTNSVHEETTSSENLALTENIVSENLIAKENSEDDAAPISQESKISSTPDAKNIVSENPIAKENSEDEAAPTSQELKTSSTPDATPVIKLSQTRTSFMRPTPRLDGGGRIRRNSIQGSGASASESEDDTRRTTSVLTNRMKNDSVNSLHSPKRPNLENSNTTISSNSGNTTPQNTASNTVPNKNSSSTAVRHKRKSNVSESARKLAEAKREFLVKYEHKQPDRTKLTMYDLIYYNPMTNPIKETSIPTTPQNSFTEVSRMEEDDAEDDEEECDKKDAMPVPQVKVGPDGHLILDEQSLVIEHTGAKKSRQALAKTEALVDENINGTGFYKKRRKTKDWPKWETLKFYKALNTVGTDFSLMQSLFPQRTRQEIKLKFKKEEKTNRRFVEKALVYHQEFDVESLKEDLAAFEESESKQPESTKTKKSDRRCNGPKRKRSKSRRMVALSIAESNEDIDESEICTEEKKINKEDEEKSDEQFTSNENCPKSDTTDNSNDSESEPEVYQVKPTRSGRIPKTRILQAPKINTLDNLFSDPEQEIEESTDWELKIADDEEEDPTSCEIEKMAAEEAPPVNKDVVPMKSQNTGNCVPNISQVEPGSLVIVSRESVDEPGETVLQVYMVGSENENSLENSPETK